MIHIATCGHIGSFAENPAGDGGGFPFSFFEECARQAGFSRVCADVFDSPLELIEAMGDSRLESAIDVVVCGTDIPGMQGIQLVRELRRENHAQHMVVVAEGFDHAAEALANGVDAYFVTPVERTDFENDLVKVFRMVKDEREESFELRTREGVRRIRLSNFSYAETVDHDQAIHLVDGTVFTLRASSQALFDQLQAHSCIFKAGSSYIVNIRLVKLVDSRASTAELFDGTVIPIPGRVRIPLENAILS